jgi:choline dehydrogenase-like flavoprotein
MGDVITHSDAVPRGECLRTEVCIVGAGAAGITLARALSRHRVDVTLLESGTLQPIERSQGLYEGATTGRYCYPLDACRLRQFGGTTNAWGGWCRPLDAIDFERRDWVPHSGWPFEKQQLDRYYAQAHEVCGLGASDYETAAKPVGAAGLLGPDNAAFQDMLFRINPIRFGQIYKPLFDRSERVRLLLNASAVEIVMDSANAHATQVRCATLGGNEFAIHSKWVVLAGGGIENARLLLASRGSRSTGVGNQHDLVGRFFSDHAHVPIGLVGTRGVKRDAFYAPHRRADCVVRGGLGLTEQYARSARRLGFAVSLHNADDPHDVLSPQTSPSYNSMRYLLKSLSSGRRPARPFHHLRTVADGFGEAASLAYRRVVPASKRRLMVGARAEQVPNPMNRITLEDRRDALGMPTVRLTWNLAPEDLENIRVCRARLLDELVSAGAQVSTGTTQDERWPELIRAAAHHSGTTRMHRDPARGVVDEHCRVHGVRNVFVAGSSVFPTAGSAPPTLTIVALALKLSDHLRTLCGS